ncbi:MAG: hypothetical protein WBC20_12820 [Candidatus Aminicenantaceae bacterium]
MKKQILIIGILALSLAIFAQELTHESLVINIEVPVRVFKGSTFVDNLTIDDFEVYEDGMLQKTEAIYLVKKTSIERREEKKRFSPETSRNFFLFFEVTEHTSKLGDAVSYFVKNVLVPGDNLAIITPVKTYRMKSQTLEILPKEEVVDQLKAIIRRDAVIGNTEYRSAVNDLTSLARELSSSPDNQDSFTSGEFRGMEFDEKLTRYADLLRRLDHMRYVDQQKLLDFAEYLKDSEGQKNVFLFYQREFIPQIERRVLNQYMSLNQDRQDILFTLSELFDFYRRDITVDVNKVKQAYSDSSISMHFLFFTKPPQIIPGVYMAEHSGDVYSAFKEMAEATGGFTESSANPVSLFQNAVEASETYYLLYYSPLNYKRDGKFKQIKIKIKDKNYRISHRAGYFAN